ncbi:hypothetical protein QBC47DRAFT_387448 [Echria macrotheca]|uniref:NAD(P)-binding domain-containing protein n=1 Tax=Echria macrotheca TaxID=438768 RepID=A0AAJ0BA35_9PEZI|nr:hypothetical protein QBC47DRAFT_387448 [Echria macrotheca]
MSNQCRPTSLSLGGIPLPHLGIDLHRKYPYIPTRGAPLGPLRNSCSPSISHRKILTQNDGKIKMTHVLILGGYGKVAQHLTPLLLKRSWAVTSIIRDPAQTDAVKKLGEKISHAGKHDVLVRSLEEITSDEGAKAVIDEVGADYIVWSAGAGGKGDPSRTFKIDRDAAIHFIRAASHTPRVTRFLLVSYNSSRRSKPSWWSDEEWAAAEHINKEILPHYNEAKVAADEALYSASRETGGRMAGICLRPSWLTDEPAGGVELGKTKTSRGSSSRESVARVADALLAVEGVGNVWLDMLDGEEDVEEAVKRVVREKVNAAEGEEVYQGRA